MEKDRNEAYDLFMFLDNTQHELITMYYQTKEEKFRELYDKCWEILLDHCKHMGELWEEELKLQSILEKQNLLLDEKKPR